MLPTLISPSVAEVGITEILRLTCPVFAGVDESDAEMVRLYVPGESAIPLIKPAGDSPNPGGSEPLAICQL